MSNSPCGSYDKSHRHLIPGQVWRNRSPGSRLAGKFSALTNATLPLALAIAGKGLERAAAENRALLRGINTYKGMLVSREVAESQGRVAEKLPFGSNQ